MPVVLSYRPQVEGPQLLQHQGVPAQLQVLTTFATALENALAILLLAWFPKQVASLLASVTCPFPL